MSIEYVVTFAIISAAGVILASVLNVSNFSRNQKQEAKEESSTLAASLATMSTTLDHMDVSIRDMRSEMSVNMRDIKQDIKDSQDPREGTGCSSAARRADGASAQQLSGVTVLLATVGLP